MKKVKKLSGDKYSDVEKRLFADRIYRARDILKYSHLVYSREKSKLSVILLDNDIYINGLGLFTKEDVTIEYIPYYNEIFILLQGESRPFNSRPKHDKYFFQNLQEGVENPIFLYYLNEINYIIKNDKVNKFIDNIVDELGGTGSIFYGFPLTDENMTKDLENALFKYIEYLFFDEDAAYKFNLDNLINKNKNKQKFLNRNIILKILMNYKI